MTISALDYPNYVTHGVGENACGGVAFYTRQQPEPGDLLVAEDAIYLDGEQPEPHQAIKCSACGATFTMAPDAEDVHRRPAPHEVDNDAT